MRFPNTIINLTKNPLHHFADASSTSIMATSSSNSSASNRRSGLQARRETSVDAFMDG
ncbi:hypothetical protein RHGRI_012047 [Rhododendron griersonianum]|uniref:Uncharacterized protein n=1 Tax=Rhododendron griersonianum TaxID=479676 RepID=A0AAV6KQC8_9ERIC|nr:hypothetical protein RHGRI_012047 [Rhododendron griersonianum]